MFQNVSSNARLFLNRPLRGNVNFFREQTEDCAASLLTCVYVRCSSTQMRTFTDETER